MWATLGDGDQSCWRRSSNSNAACVACQVDGTTCLPEGRDHRGAFSRILVGCIGVNCSGSGALPVGRSFDDEGVGVGAQPVDCLLRGEDACSLRQLLRWASLCSRSRSSEHALRLNTKHRAPAGLMLSATSPGECAVWASGADSGPPDSLTYGVHSSILPYDTINDVERTRGLQWLRRTNRIVVHRH